MGVDARIESYGTIDELNVAQLLHQLNDPSKLNSAVQSAILHAAEGQIVDRFKP